MSGQQELSKPHWVLGLVGSGIVISLLTVALMLGRYAQQVDDIARTIEKNGETGRENLRLLSKLESGQEVQEQVNTIVEKRLDRLEGKSDAS